MSGISRWADQPTWNYKEATSTATKGYSSSCNDGWVSISGTSFFQRAATAKQTYGYMGIRATNETDGSRLLTVAEETARWDELRAKYPEQFQSPKLPGSSNTSSATRPVQ